MSVNKEVESYNLQADTFQARRIICDQTCECCWWHF